MSEQTHNEPGENPAARFRSIRTQLIQAFLLMIVFVFLINAYLAYTRERAVRRIDHVYMKNTQLNELSKNLDDLHRLLYEYLNTKRSNALESYYDKEQSYLSKLDMMEKTLQKDAIRLTEKNIWEMSQSYLRSASDAIEAKRARNISRYNEAYALGDEYYEFIKSTLRSLNHVTFQENARRYEQMRRSMHTMEICSGFLLIGAFLASVLWIVVSTRRLTQPLIRLADAAHEIASGQMDVDFPVVRTADEIETVARACNRMMSSIRMYIVEMKKNMERERRLKENELIIKSDLKEAQLNYLQAQINPHFLFNTLNAGAQLAMLEGAERTNLFIQNMADFFRYNVRTIEKETTLGSEITLTDSYVYILNVRFSDMIRYEKIIDERLLGHRMPSMILQPLIENAVNHGIRVSDTGGVVRIRIYAEDGRVFVAVEDSGPGFDPGTAEHLVRGDTLREENDGVVKAEVGIGMDNVISRLRTFYARDDVMRIGRSDLGGAAVILCLGKDEESVYESHAL